MENKSGIKPVGHRLLVLPVEAETKTASGIVLATATEAQRMQMSEVQAMVIELGSDAYADKKEAWCQPGQVILMNKYIGIVRKGRDGKNYRLINDLDVAAILEVKTNE